MLNGLKITDMLEVCYGLQKNWIYERRSGKDKSKKICREAA